MLFTVVPFEGAGHSGLGTLAARVAQFGQFDRITLTVKNGSYDPMPVNPLISLTTWASFRFICSSAFCMCWM